jgi:NAD(P)-dependent dehydrogenase (short-subunit alcohol dehydrogenase family)
MKRLAGKTALITGAARGLGAAIARRFVDEGANVIINDLSLDAARTTAEAIGGHAVAADVSRSADVERMFDAVAKLAPHLDILVNNAGISGSEGRNDTDERVQQTLRRTAAAARGEPVEPNNTTLETTDEDWHRMLRVHVDGTFFCSRAALRTMTARRAGSIINMGSIMGTFGRAGPTHYCTAKAAVLGFTRALAHEVADRNIRVNAIAPGWILTDMTSPLEAMHPLLAAQTPLGRIGEPDDIAWAAVYLASDEAKFVTGQTLSPNGGWYMSQ